MDHITNTLIFLAEGINSHWNLYLGYFLNGSNRPNLMQKCLQFLREIVVKVHNITFYGAYSNLSTCTKLGVNRSFNLNNPQFFFLQPKTQVKIFIFFYPFHIIKLVRSTLSDKRIKLMLRENKLNEIIYINITFKRKRKSLFILYV